MSTASENRSSIVQSESDGTVEELHKQPKVSYTREFLISLAELDTCKQLPCGLDLSILREHDASNRSSQSSRGSDSGKCYDNLSRHSWQNSGHDGLLGAGFFPRVSGCLAGASALGVREKGCLLHRSDEPYRPPRPYKAVPPLRRQISDSYKDETFGSSEHLSHEITEEERRGKASFELMRKEQKNQIQEKQNKISDDRKENLDPDMVALLQDSVKDKRPVDVCNESEQYAAPAASNHNSDNRASIEGCATIPTITPGFTSRFFQENLDRKSLTHSPATKSDYTKSLALCSSAFAPQSVEEDEKHGSGISSNMRGGSKVYGMPHGNATETCRLLSNGNELSPKLTTYTSQSAKVGISEQLFGCNKPTVTTGALTCGDLELSFLFKINENDSIQHHYEQDGSINDTENGQPNSPNQCGASQHLLSLLQKGTVLTDLAASPDKSLLFEVGTGSNVISIFGPENAGKSDNQEALRGTSFTKELQLTDASLFLQKGSQCRVTKDDASLPCGFASPVMDNSFFPSKVDEYGPSVVNQEGIMSSSYNTLTDSSEMKGNRQVSDDILAKIGSKDQPKEGLKLNPVRDFDEKSDSTIEICLPDEDSLITFDDYCFLPDEDSLITGDDDFWLPSDENSLFSPSSQVHNTEKPSGLNVTLSHENSSQLHSEHPTADRISYGFVGLEPSNHTRAQKSYPQLHHTQPYTGQAFLYSLGSQTYLHPARNSTKAKTYPCSHSPHKFCSTSVLPSRFQQTHGEPTMFDHPVNHMLLQQMSIPHKLPPRQLNGHPRGVMPDFPVNQIACYGQELNPMQDFYPTYEQPNFAGLGMPNQYFIDPHVARDDNHRKFNALSGKELGASFPGSGRGRSSLGNQVDIRFWYEQ